MICLDNDWQCFFDEEQEKPYFKSLINNLDKQYNEKTIYPPKEQLYSAFLLTEYKEIKVVLLGQDPYIKCNQANGLAFSVNKTEKVPPSLKNVFKEIITTSAGTSHTCGDLTPWAKQGVFLLNTVLSVQEGISNSHKDLGWITFTDNVISYINKNKSPIVYMLWGNKAKEKMKLLTNKNHLILAAAHPSPLASGSFFGNNHFNLANDFLISNGSTPINWNT